MVSKKPRFTLDFAINELSNIPHTSGYCYVDVLIGDGHQSGLRATISSLKPVTKSSSAGSSDDVSNTKKPLATDSKDSSATVSSSRSGNIHVRTSRRKIHNFKCFFNYKMSCNLKFAVRKRDAMIGPKFLNLRVYFVADKSKSALNLVELGLVRLNLSEYLNFNEPVTTKYLLQDAKINSILSLTLGLDELPSDYEFHTQLRIDDSKHSGNAALNGSMLTFSTSADATSRSFNVPQFQRKTVFSGFEDVMQKNQPIIRLGGLATSSDDDKGQAANKSENQNTGGESKADNPHFGLGTFDNVIVDPTISRLYLRVLESTWDPELHSLLKYSPEKIVDDIFSSNGDACRKLLEKDIEMYGTDQDSSEGYKDMNGLISEIKYRDNLKSWTVSWV